MTIPFELFRHALAEGDELTQFLALYNVIALMAEDGEDDAPQAAVERLIRSIDPGVQEEPDPVRFGAETVFTKLRNEIAHGDDDARRRRDGGDLRREVRERLPAFRALVAEALRNGASVR